MVELVTWYNRDSRNILVKRLDCWFRGYHIR